MLSLDVLNRESFPSAGWGALAAEKEFSDAAKLGIPHRLEADLNTLKITIPRYDLVSSKGQVGIWVQVTKIPFLPAPGAPIGDFVNDEPGVHSPKLSQLLRSAEQLRSLPEIQRPRAIVNLIRSSVDYAYPTDELLGRELSADDERFRARIWKFDPSVRLSEVCEHGLGVCAHMAALFQHLAAAADLQSAYQSAVCRFENFIVPGTARPLFSLVNLGPNTISHAWNEAFLSNGEIVPVDASTRIVGDCLADREVFQRAGHHVKAIPDFIFNAESISGSVTSDMEIPAGQRSKNIVISVRPAGDPLDLIISIRRHAWDANRLFAYQIDEAIPIQADFIKPVPERKRTIVFVPAPKATNGG